MPSHGIQTGVILLILSFILLVCGVYLWFLPMRNWTFEDGTGKVIVSGNNDIYGISSFHNDTKRVESLLRTNLELKSLFYQVGVETELHRSLNGSPFHHLTNFKNPCWISSVPNKPYKGTVSSVLKPLLNLYKKRKTKDKQAWRLRCMPYFYILGVMKSGTTDLFERLTMHPEIHSAKAKECRFWDRYLKYDGKKSSTKGMSEYFDYFDAAAEMILKKGPEKGLHGYHSGITLDASPTTFWLYQGWQYQPGNIGLKEPKYIGAHTIRALSPNAKFLVILREPVSRVRSHYLMIRPHSSAKEFHEVVVGCVKLWNECVAESGMRACVYNYTLPKGGPDELSIRYITGSMYSVFLADWMDVFDKDQIFVIKAEDYYNQMAGTMTNVFKFLEVEDPKNINKYTKKGAINTAESRGRTTEPMWPITQHILDVVFEPMKEQLVEMLGDERFYWEPTS